MKSWHKYLIALIIVTLLIIAPLIWIYRLQIFEVLYQARIKAEELGRLNPLYLILAIAILPIIGIPVSFLYILGGIAYGFYWGVIYALIGVTINTTVCYWLAHSFMKEWIIKMLNKRGHKLIQVPPKDYNITIFAVRLMPGIPVAAQSYVLGLSGVPFVRYAIITFIAEVFWAIFFILPTKTLVGNTTQSLILLGIAVLVLVLLLKVIRDLIKRHKQ